MIILGPVFLLRFPLIIFLRELLVQSLLELSPLVPIWFVIDGSRAGDESSLPADRLTRCPPRLVSTPVHLGHRVIQTESETAKFAGYPNGGDQSFTLWIVANFVKLLKLITE